MILPAVLLIATEILFVAASRSAGPETAPATRPKEPNSPFITPATRPTGTQPGVIEAIPPRCWSSALRRLCAPRPSAPRQLPEHSRHARPRLFHHVGAHHAQFHHASLAHQHDDRRDAPGGTKWKWNRDFKTVDPLYPRVPTLFEAAKRHGYTTAVAVGKEKFDMLDRPGVLDWKFIPTKTMVETADVIGPAIDIIRQYKPDVMLVHLPSVDNRGHQMGWASPQQMKAIEDADTAVGKLLKVMDETGLSESTLTILTADHGGAGRNHGPDDPRSRHIPWVAIGPHIRHGVDLTVYPKLTVEHLKTLSPRPAG